MTDAYRALVIHGDEGVRREIRRALEARGIEALTAPCGLTGLDLLIERLFEIAVVVAEAEAPGLDGWRLARLIRQLGNEQDLHLLVTGVPAVPIGEALVSIGVDAVLDRSAGAERIAARAAALLARGQRRPVPTSLTGLALAGAW
ncbi:MAG TPA: response regulator [Anaeromyxobacteraceae bacterium]|nr:response regulator [Anaeromyxobacteraceae bacterium]